MSAPEETIRTMLWRHEGVTFKEAAVATGLKPAEARSHISQLGRSLLITSQTEGERGKVHRARIDDMFAEVRA